MTAPEIYDMVEALEIPESFVTSNRYVFTSIEAFCLLCTRFWSAGDMYQLSMQYDRSQSSISECVNKLVEFLDEEWEHLLGRDEGHLLRPFELAQHADAIHHWGAPLKSVAGFINCTIH